MSTEIKMITPEDGFCKCLMRYYKCQNYIKKENEK